MNRFHCGVDFGTTNSTVGLCERGNAPFLIPVEGDHVTIPSALFFSLEDGSVHFGRSAVHEYMDGAEGRFMRALKSILGTSLMKETTAVGRERMSFQDLIGRFLRHLKARLEQHSGGMPEHVVFGRPVFFIDGDETADRAAQDQLAAAARAEGFRHIEFQFEPVAAALHFERMLNEEALALVVDIGGGTSDFSVLRLSPERARATDRRGDILSTSGVHVGGTDFDRCLNIAEVMPHLGLGTKTLDGKRNLPVWYFNDMATWHRINQLYTAKNLRDIQSLAREAAEPEKLARFEHLLEHRSGHRLAAQVEKAKIALTDAPDTIIRLVEPGLSMELPVDRHAFEAASTELAAKISIAIDDALVGAGVAGGAIDTVIMTGGGALVPLVRTAVTSRFPDARIAQSDQFGSVGLGLAVDAARRFG
ncbi:Hsp70 family protein [Phyllobacterium leguminum]|uniref:Putative chaperone protein n=1 Tax=Phyllobacterium leguminum TaxID=314237 RepID=A0A318SWW7_9HYPH|nr:Hsp70 family protein [Phyllobacterium leguminum]PYE86410.1 putative chaperone protein [Phyllobacterium leguminum]